jgi:transposase
MTEIIINNIENICDLAMFAESYKKGFLKLNISKLAKELNKDRKTIKKYLEGKVPSGKRVRVKYLDKYRELIIKLLTDKYRSFDYIDHLYNYLVREHQITCSRSTLNRYVRNDDEINSLFNKKKTQKFYERFETKPGLQAQFDLKEKVKIIYKTGEVERVNVATLTLGFSRFNVREIVIDTKYETIESFLAGAFETIGGVPEELVIDNIKCLVDRPRTKDTEAILNVKFEEFLRDYNIKCKPCMPYRPETKGKTETQNKKPSQLENYNGIYNDLLDVHEKLKIINDEDNKSISQATNMPRIVLLNKEKGDFSPLPPRRIREKYHLSLNPVAVTKDSLVSYKSNKYSVPKRLIGFKVNLIVKNSQLHIYYNNKIVTVHQISKNKLNIKECHDLHYPKRENKDYKETNSKEIIIEEMRNIIYD